jgi:hypothetical protein
MSGDLLFYDKKNNFTVSVTPRAGVHTAVNIINTINDELGVSAEYDKMLINESFINKCDINIKLVRNPYLRVISSYRWFFGHGHLVGVPREIHNVSFEGYLNYLKVNKNNLYSINHHFRPQNNGRLDNKMFVIKNDDINNVKTKIKEIFRSKRNISLSLDSLIAGGLGPRSNLNPTEYIGNLLYNEVVKKYTHGINKKWFYNEKNKSDVTNIFKRDLEVFNYNWCF